MKVPVAVELLKTVKKHIYDGFLTLHKSHKGKLVKNYFCMYKKLQHQFCIL